MAAAPEGVRTVNEILLLVGGGDNSKEGGMVNLMKYRLHAIQISLSQPGTLMSYKGKPH